MNKLLVLVLMSFSVFAQNVGINNTDPQHCKYTKQNMD